MIKMLHDHPLIHPLFKKYVDFHTEKKLFYIPLLLYESNSQNQHDMVKLFNLLYSCKAITVEYRDINNAMHTENLSIN